MTPLVIFGAGGHAREILELVSCLNEDGPAFEVLGFADDDSAMHHTELKGLPVMSRDTLLARRSSGLTVVVALGPPALRRRIALWLDEVGISSPTLVHPRAWVGRDVELGPGTQIAAGACISTDVTIGRHAIVNQGATVAHDVRAADFATLAPGVRLSGAVSVDEGSDIGTGASVLQGLRIGAWSVVGAGAAIIRDVPLNTTVVGVPGRVIDTRSAGWHDAK